MESRRRPAPVKTRSYTKRIVARTLVGLFALAILGWLLGRDDVPDVISAVGPWALALILTYAGIGHLDLRASLGQGLASFIGGLSGSRRRRPPEDGE